MHLYFKEKPSLMQDNLINFILKFILSSKLIKSCDIITDNFFRTNISDCPTTIMFLLGLCANISALFTLRLCIYLYTLTIPVRYKKNWHSMMLSIWASQGLELSLNNAGWEQNRFKMIMLDKSIAWHGAQRQQLCLQKKDLSEIRDLQLKSP